MKPLADAPISHRGWSYHCVDVSPYRGDRMTSARRHEAIFEGGGAIKIDYAIHSEMTPEAFAMLVDMDFPRPPGPTPWSARELESAHARFMWRRRKARRATIMGLLVAGFGAATLAAVTVGG